MTPTGWTCPKCGAVYAPVVIECHRCNAATLTVQETGVTEEPKPRLTDTFIEHPPFVEFPRRHGALAE